MSVAKPVAPALFEDPAAPGHKLASAFLDDATYAAAIDGLIIVCADTIIYNQARRTVYLSRRIVYPMMGLWIHGGRVKRGVDGLQMMVKQLKTETGHDVDPARLRFLSMNRYLWVLRKQEPTDGGSDNLCYTFGYQPTEAELDAIRDGLSPTEYDIEFGLQEFTREQLVESGVHPVIIKLYDELFPAPRSLPERLRDAWAALVG